jgi:hypothetical protein
MKKIYKYLVSLAILALVVSPVFMKPALADDDPYGINVVNTGLNNSLSAADPISVTTKIINLALGFLGIIAVVIILLGGFKWMTAGGNEEKTSEAKKLLGAGIIGLVIVLMAWGIASYLITNLSDATHSV